MGVEFISVSRANVLDRLDNSQQIYDLQKIRERKSTAKTYHRRLKVARQKRTMFFLAMALVLGVIFAIFVLGTNAQATSMNQASTSRYKYYKEVYVERGDSLWSIAKDNTDGSVDEIMNCMNEIQEINCISSKAVLKTGTYLVVPYYSEKYME